MAPGRKTGGRDFVKGDPNIPKSPGGPHLPAEDRAARELNKVQSFKLIQKYAWMNKGDLVNIKNEDLPLYERGILKSFLSFAQTGAIHHIQFWLDHLVGKPVQAISNPDGTGIFATISKISDVELERRIDEMYARLHADKS